MFLLSLPPIINITDFVQKAIIIHFPAPFMLFISFFFLQLATSHPCGPSLTPIFCSRNHNFHRLYRSVNFLIPFSPSLPFFLCSLPHLLFASTSQNQPATPPHPTPPHHSLSFCLYFNSLNSFSLPPLPLLVSLIQWKAFVIGQYLYQLGPGATWDNGLQSDPGHSKQNHSPALHGSVQSSLVQSSLSATHPASQTGTGTALFHTQALQTHR